MASETITRNDLTNILNEMLPPRNNGIIAQYYQGTTDSAGVLLIPKTVFDIDKMHLVNIIGVGNYAEGVAVGSGITYVRIVRYDGQSVANTQVEVYVYYVKVLD